MSSKHSILKGGATLTLGQGVSQACAFIRSIIVARLISPADFGIAATFAVTISVFEMMTNLSADKLLVQAKDGDEPGFQKTAQAISAGRSLMVASVIFLMGRPIANLFGEPQARWAFELLALVPLVRGLFHLDTARLQREMHFRPSVTVDVGSQLLVTAAAVPLTFWLRDYTAMLWVLILQAASATVISHVVAEREYGWAWEKSYARRIISFGWPLLINGLLLFVILDGDRFIIGSAHRLFPRSSMTLSDLGVWSVAFALAMAPTSLIANVSNSLLLPPLSRLQHDRGQFNQRHSEFAQAVALVGLAVSVPLIVAGGPLIVAIYGGKYAAAGKFAGWLAAMSALRMVRQAPTIAAMALGDTRNAMWSNVARTVALAGVLFTAATGRGVVWIAISGFIGEVLAMAVCLWRLDHRHAIPASFCVRPFAALGAGMLVAGFASWGGIAHMGLVLCVGAAGALVVIDTLAMLVLFPSLRHRLARAIAKVWPLLGSPEVAST
jgi:O-antigen/teichoic acid export membrane protein